MMGTNDWVAGADEWRMWDDCRRFAVSDFPLELDLPSGGSFKSGSNSGSG